jgi:hypothetical protein
MTDTLAGLPFWALEFEKDGAPTQPGAVDTFLNEVGAQGVTDLFLFSHGWNNDRTTAMSLYDRFLQEVGKLLQDASLPKKKANAKVGAAGVIWPSILWPDDAASAASNAVVSTAGGGAVAMTSGAPVPAAQASAQEINTELKRGYADADQQTLIDELTAMLDAQPKSNAALVAFRTKLGQLLASEPTDSAADHKHPDQAEGAMAGLSDAKWRALLEVLGDQAASRGASTGGAAGLGDPFKKLWSGAKDALRVATYWQMKQRAGIVGRKGLGSVLARLPAQAPNVRVNLLGHSFGARLVSYSLAGLPPALTGGQSPVKSLFLLQGAFSHYAFADSLPHDATRSGGLKGMAARVDGPLLTTHTLKDLAVGVSYPAASFVNQDDAAAAVDQSIRWGAMGHDGAQAVQAKPAALGAPGTPYVVAKGQWLNLDGNQVIIHGGLPSGAHSDIVHPHTAWAALSAAGIV